MRSKVRKYYFVLRRMRCLLFTIEVGDAVMLENEKKRDIIRIIIRIIANFGNCVFDQFRVDEIIVICHNRNSHV